MASEVYMNDIICLILLIIAIASIKHIDNIEKQLDRIERRLEVITPAFECAGYTYNYDVEEYCTEESVKDSLNLP